MYLPGHRSEERRAMILAVPAEMLLGLLNQLDGTQMVVFDGLPADARAVAVNARFERNAVEVLVESATFPAAEPGACLPQWAGGPSVRLWWPEVQPNGDMLFKLADLQPDEQARIKLALIARGWLPPVE